jgi:hypothetical protein
MTTQELKRELTAILSADVRDTAASEATKMRYGGERVLK